MGSGTADLGGKIRIFIVKDILVIAVDDDRVLILVDPFVFPAVAHMNMAVDEILGFVFFHQRTETFKTLMGKIFPVVEPPGGGMGQKNIEAFVADQFHPEFPDAGPHFFFGVLVRAVAVAHGTAKSEDTDPFVDIEIIIHTDAALGRGHFILVIVVSVNIENRTVRQCYQKTEISGTQIPAGDDKVNALQL